MSELILTAEPYRLLFGAFLSGALCTSFARVWVLRRAAQAIGGSEMRRVASVG